MEQPRPHPIRLSLRQAKLTLAAPAIHVPVPVRPVPGQGRGQPQFATTKMIHLLQMVLTQMVLTRPLDRGSFASSTITYSRMAASPTLLNLKLVGCRNGISQRVLL